MKKNDEYVVDVAEGGHQPGDDGGDGDGARGHGHRSDDEAARGSASASLWTPVTANKRRDKEDSLMPAGPRIFSAQTGYNFFERHKKAICLVMLSVQNTALTLLVSYSRNIRKESYILSVNILLTELLKCAISAAVILKTTRKTLKSAMASSSKTFIPAALFFLQNTLLFVALGNLDAGVYIVINQLKTVTAAICSVIILRKVFTITQWRALFVLVLAVVLVQAPRNTNCNPDEAAAKSKTNFIGVVAAISMTLTSGVANVTLEKLFKSGEMTLWERNLQLGLFSSIFAVFNIFSDLSLVREKGLFGGFSATAFLIVLTQAVGGILVAMVMKYADNIVKGFAVSVAIVATSILSSVLFGASIDLVFCVGAVLPERKPPPPDLPLTQQQQQQDQKHQQQLALATTLETAAAAQQPTTTTTPGDPTNTTVTPTNTSSSMTALLPSGTPTDNNEKP
ncbi:UDP-galactose transporter [Pelomyxa schiedti]|nr:UDP-galactose transporter [Pelomyxa schiedti]